MNQIAKIFSMNTMRSNQISIDKQINDYLEEHPAYTIGSVSYILAGVFEKALVIFNEMPEEINISESEARADIPNKQFNPKKKHFQQQNNSQFMEEKK